MALSHKIIVQEPSSLDAHLLDCGFRKFWHGLHPRRLINEHWAGSALCVRTTSNCDLESFYSLFWLRDSPGVGPDHLLVQFGIAFIACVGEGSGHPQPHPLWYLNFYVGPRSRKAIVIAKGSVARELPRIHWNRNRIFHTLSPVSFPHPSIAIG
jgi:hypothetical protein